MGKTSKEKVGAATAGPSKQYMKLGGTKTKMGTGGAAGKVQVKGPNKAAKATPMKKGGSSYKYGGKKGM